MNADAHGCKKQKVIYRIDRSSQYWDFHDWLEKVVWWGHRKGAYLYENVEQVKL